jgi:hypothetical protein
MLMVVTASTAANIVSNDSLSGKIYNANELQMASH